MSHTPPADPARSGAAAEPTRPAIQQAAEQLAAGQPAAAAEALRALVDRAPTYAAAHVLLAVALEAAGQAAPALEAWQRASVLVPRSPLVARERARLAAQSASAPPALADASAKAPAKAPPPAQTAEPDPAEPEQTEPEVAVEDATGDAPSASDETPPADAPDGAAAQSSHDVSDDPFGDEALFETLPLDDLATSLAPPPDADETLDPGDFDFSAFDLGDDDADWLLGADASDDGTRAADDAAAPPTADWNDRTLPSDWSEATRDSVQLLAPEVPAPTPEIAPETPGDVPAGGEWAVFEDEALEHEALQDEAPQDEARDAGARADGLPFVFEDAFPLPPASDEPAGDPPAGAPAAPSVADELDSLIASLEDAPRIRPDPSFSGPAVGSETVRADSMASETLARIYAAQKQYDEAARVYDALAERLPARADEMRRHAAEMRQKGA